VKVNRFAGSPVIAAVMPGQDRRVWAVAAELCQCLRAHLTFAFVDPASYLVELTPRQVILRGRWIRSLIRKTTPLRRQQS